MTRSIRSYPEHQRLMVVQRRMRAYDPKGENGCGTLAAHDYHIKKLLSTPTTNKAKVKKALKLLAGEGEL